MFSLYKLKIHHISISSQLSYWPGKCVTRFALLSKPTISNMSEIDTAIVT